VNPTNQNQTTINCLDLNLTRREILNDVYAAYNEVRTMQSAIKKSKKMPY
jgi:hypothetical protein